MQWLITSQPVEGTWDPNTISCSSPWRVYSCTMYKRYTMFHPPTLLLHSIPGFSVPFLSRGINTNVALKYIKGGTGVLSSAQWVGHQVSVSVIIEHLLSKHEGNALLQHSVWLWIPLLYIYQSWTIGTGCFTSTGNLLPFMLCSEPADPLLWPQWNSIFSALKRPGSPAPLTK